VNKLEPGEIVRRCHGKAPLRVIRVRGHLVRAAYCGNTYELEGAEYSAASLVRYCNLEDIPENYRGRLSPDDIAQLKTQNQTETTMPKLYQTKEEPARFGTLLAMNSARLLVLEMKGSGDVLTFTKDEVEEVKPYTVRVSFGDGGKTYDFFSRKGDVEVGDLLMIDGYSTIARVMAVDTKSDGATKNLTGRKVATVPFGEDLIE